MLSKQEMSKLKRFLEDFSWLMETYSKVDLKKVALLIGDSFGESNDARRTVGVFGTTSPNIHYLTGVLPSLFMDETLFRTNDDIAEFASSVLHLAIPRYHKKSKYEIIGHIVCEANKLNEVGLDKLVRAMARLINDDKGKEMIAKKKTDQSFSWNDMIQSLMQE